MRVHVCEVSETSEVVTDDLNGVVALHLSTVVLYNSALVVDPVAGVDAHC